MWFFYAFVAFLALTVVGVAFYGGRALWRWCAPLGPAIAVVAIAALSAGGTLFIVGCRDFDRRAAVSYLADNREAIAEVGREFGTLVPDGMSVGVEYGWFGKIDFSAHWDSSGTRQSVQVWNASLADPEVRRGLEALGWTEKEVRRVRDLVRSVGGIGIDGPLGAGGVRIRYRRHNMGMYSFVVSDSALVAEDGVGFDGCSSYFLDTRTSLTYGGPAFGTDCMPPPDSW